MGKAPVDRKLNPNYESKRPQFARLEPFETDGVAAPKAEDHLNHEYGGIFPEKVKPRTLLGRKTPGRRTGDFIRQAGRECLVITFMDYERRLLFWHPGNDWQDTDQFAEDKIASMEGLLSENFEWTWTPRDLNWWLARRVAA